MISKIRKYQDSWITKSILALTALSFMSLFGISSYVSSAGKNRAVIKVDKLEILQDEMNVKLNNNIRKAQNMFGDSIEINDAMRKNILSNLVKENLTSMIIAREAQKEGVSISDELIQQIIATQPEFMDASGRFSPEALRRQLSYFDMSEQEYINELRQNILDRHLVYSPVTGVKFPQFMNDYIAKIENQQKVFNYVEVNPSSLKIDRTISDEEIEQYYQDFAPQFEEAERRDVSFIELKISDLSKGYIPSEDEIKDYYKENSDNYITPEKRQVLQMVFDTEEKANEAFALLQKGQDFYQVAANKANQDKETTNLGNVTTDSLLPELTEDAFDAKLNQVVGPINSEFGWHILKITNITPKKETPLSSVRNKIISLLQQEQAYDQALTVVSEIEDKIGAGSDLKSISEEYKSKIYQVKGLKDDGNYSSLSNSKFKDLVTSSDFIENAFSYNQNEISQTVETEDGFVLLSVNNIQDAHIKDLDIVKPEIIKIWTENEKSAIAQEIVNDVVADLDNGENLADIANRFNIKLKTTSPLKRGESFAGLNTIQTTEAYQTPLNEYKLLTNAGSTIIVTPTKVINTTKAVSKKQKDDINLRMQKETEQNLASELIDAYAKDMDVRVKYRLLGLED
jgi:peptidyl-prolyl cis-trans isomerase D